MSNRTLARLDDGLMTIQADGEFGYEGWHSELRIERSSAGRPGLVFIIDEYDGGRHCGQSCVSVRDGKAFLATVNHWLETGERP